MSKVLCIGDIALDVIVRLDGQGLSQLRYGSDTPSEISTHGGGTAANVASWLHEVGTPALLLARVGDDSVGEALIAEIQDLGIDTHKIIVPSKATGTVVVLVDESGERTMLPDSGANAGLSESDLPSLDGISSCYISGYSLFNRLSHDGVHRIFKRLHSVGIETFLDPASVGTMLNSQDGRKSFNQFQSLMFCSLMNLKQNSLAARVTSRRCWSSCFASQESRSSNEVSWVQ